jgi:hypothetical protein
MRRQAHETAMHRIDAQLAADRTEPIAQELAVDGIDELFSLRSYRGPSACTARGRRCTCAAPTATATGTATIVMASGFLFGRVGVERLEVFGDASLLARQRELLTW